MSKIVIKKAPFLLKADEFSIHTFEISRKLTKSEWNHCKERLYNQDKISSKVCIYQESKGVHRVSLYEKHAWWSIRVKSLIQVTLILGFSAGKVQCGSAASSIPCTSEAIGI